MYDYFFSIPIYRFSRDEFYKKSQELRDKSFVLKHSKFGSTFFDITYAYSWDFNEIVGWLRLYFHCSQLQVNLFLYRHRRKDWKFGLKKKEYISMDRLTEFFLDEDLHGENLTEKIIENILGAQQGDRAIREYHLDFSEFRQVANALDWKKIKTSSNPIYLRK